MISLVPVVPVRSVHGSPSLSKSAYRQTCAEAVPVDRRSTEAMSIVQIREQCLIIHPPSEARPAWGTPVQLVRLVPTTIHPYDTTLRGAEQQCSAEDGDSLKGPNSESAVLGALCVRTSRRLKRRKSPRGTLPWWELGCALAGTLVSSARRTICSGRPYAPDVRESCYVSAGNVRPMWPLGPSTVSSLALSHRTTLWDTTPRSQQLEPPVCQDRGLSL
jgi:hypothetical protein